MALGFAAVAPAFPWVGPVAGREPLRDEPVVWLEDDRRAVSVPEFREPPVLAYGIEAVVSRPFARLLNPSRWVRGIGSVFGGDHVPAATDVNALDEVRDSTWFTNRIGLFPMTPAELRQGPGGDGPDRSGPWTIVSAKTGGVSAGFVIEDARGQRYLMKFDQPEYPEIATRAAVVANRILYAIGYNVPRDHAVAFSRADLSVREGVAMTGLHGVRIPLDEAKLDSVLVSLNAFHDGYFHALTSRFVAGEAIGPFDYVGTRDDDPNDRIAHQHRRSLRGLRLFAAWIDHYDTKMQNSLDVYVGEPDRGYVRHYLIDFASTLGAQAGEYTLRLGFEYVVDFGVILQRTLALGWAMPEWTRLERPPGLREVGYWEAELWDPRDWKPMLPNSAFANLTDRDGYWAAKIVSAFDDEALRAVVAAGHYRNPAAAAYMVKVLAARRDKLARIWFAKVPPIDFFTVAEDAVNFRDLGVERGIYPGASTRYRVRCAAVDADRKARRWSAWELLESPVALPNTVPVARSADAAAARNGRGGMVSLVAGGGARALADIDADHAFFAVEVQVDRGGGWSGSTTAYVAPASGRVVALAR